MLLRHAAKQMTVAIWLVFVHVNVLSESVQRDQPCSGEQQMGDMQMQ